MDEVPFANGGCDIHFYACEFGRQASPTLHGFTMHMSFTSLYKFDKVQIEKIGLYYEN